MGSLSSPQTWLPYDKIKDCSQGICSLYCPQWCDKIKDCSQGICSLYCPQWCFFVHHPPPPPFGFSDNYDDSKTTLSPFIIVMIGILASAFLLVSYYTIISKYCGNFDLFRRRTSRDQIEEFNENQNPSQQEPWQVLTRGLDEALIKSIMVCKYKKGDGLVQGTDCSVCLGEFQEDECLRLLPKCSHAFHVTCIDTWLKSHTNCPLCRANIVSTTPLQLHEVPPQVPQNPSESEPSLQTQHENHGVDVVEASETNGEAVIPSSNIASMTPLRILKELEDLDGRDTMLEIRDEGNRKVKRSASLDSSCQSHISVFDILCSSEDDDDQIEDHDQLFQMGILGSSSKQHLEEHSKSKSRSRSFHCDINPTTMKRTFSSGRFLFTRNGRGRNVILPL